MDKDLSKLELFFESFTNRIESIRSSTETRSNQLLECVETGLDEVKTRDYISNYREKLLGLLRTGVSSDLQRDLNEFSKPSLNFTAAGGNTNAFVRLLVQRLRHKHAFSSVQKIKYVNLLRAFELNDGTFGLDNPDDVNDVRFRGYEVLSVVVLTLDRVFMYLTNTDLPDLMLTRNVNIGIAFNRNLLRGQVVLCERSTEKRIIFGPNILNFDDETIALIYSNPAVVDEQRSYTLELICTRTLETLASRRIDCESKHETFEAFLMTNSLSSLSKNELIVDLQYVHLVFDRDLKLVARLGQNSTFNEPFFTGDKELIHMSDRLVFYRANAYQRLKIVIMSRSNGSTLYSFFLPFVKEFNRLDSILIVDNEQRIVYKSFTTNNLFAFDLNGQVVTFNKIKTHDLNTRNLYYNYRTYLRNRSNYPGIENTYLFYQFSAKFCLKKIFLI